MPDTPDPILTTCDAVYATAKRKTEDILDLGVDGDFGTITNVETQYVLCAGEHDEYDVTVTIRVAKNG